MKTEECTNLAEHRDHLQDHFDHVKKTGRPMFITDAHGDPEAVVLSNDAYLALLDELELAKSLAGLAASEADFAAGRVMTVEQARERMHQHFKDASDG